MPARRPIVPQLRSRNPFPLRVVVAALRAIADDLDDIRAGRSIHLTERVTWVRKTADNAEAWLYVLHILMDRAGIDADEVRTLADQYQSVMTTRRTPVRKFTASGPRTAPPLPTLAMELRHKPPKREVDQA